MVWAAAAESKIKNTKKITDKHDELFEKVVTEGYIERFNFILRKLHPDINVRVSTVPKKGATYKQILLDNCSAGIEGATPDRILSEGEKRAVSLADFLTEADIDPGCSSVVLDDPVTSFDLGWREKAAQIFVEEAGQRQVVVFTHDLVFLYHLLQVAQKDGIDFLCHWIQRGLSDGLPGHVRANNSPALEKSYRKPSRAQGLYERAKEEPDFGERERLVRDGLGCLRTCYEAFIVYDVFNEVVQRFSERISLGRLKDIVWDEPLVREAADKHEMLSLLMEGHLHTPAVVYEELNPDVLKSEIEQFSQLKKRLKELKKKTKGIK